MDKKKCERFLDYFDDLISKTGETIPDDVKEFYDMLRTQQNAQDSRPLLTDSGCQILKYLQDCGPKNLKAKDIADGLEISSRKVSGSIRKLVTDGFVEKVTLTSPVVYKITEQGQNFDIEQYKEQQNNK